MNFTRFFQITAALALLATLGTWAATGAHRGWTQNQIPVTVHDEITGIEALHYQPGFVAGVDFLAGGIAAATALAAAAGFASRRSARRAATA
ncbi:hypothetical protein [Synoicihabitans lomoniglobus]|uniref:PDGLE domain-containing protein n=1 Tax=Synoicihabitans lomoniglobus TaxID=2909285 RepID=A0AAF0CN07_9BACT|nr:hypothetical protein [Opitutaceae bacterium LMO-M01]WED64863.1 hypothetical protein PXH66_21160 [Opitutaceae bacterium LMO-M01]